MVHTPIPEGGAPLTAEERMAQTYLHRPFRLLELATATGNRALRSIALDLLRKGKRPRRRSA